MLSKTLKNLAFFVYYLNNWHCVPDLLIKQLCFSKFFSGNIYNEHILKRFKKFLKKNIFIAKLELYFLLFLKIVIAINTAKQMSI